MVVRTDRRARRRAIAAGVAAALWGASGGPLHAENQEVGRLHILDPRASEAELGDASRIRMKIVNGGYDSLHIVGMSSPVAGEVTMELPLENGEARPLQSIPVPANGDTSVGPSHIRVLLRDLRKRIARGDRVPVTLHFPGGRHVEIRVVVGRDEGARDGGRRAD